MIRATKEFLAQLDALAQKRRDEIRSAKDDITVTGTAYFVSNDGDDTNDGKSPQKAWKTLARVSSAEFAAGDGVFFRRGDLFRGFVNVRPGVTYAAFGTGEKPKFYGWDKSLADPALWELVDAKKHIWKLTEPILDCGTLIFNDGQAHSRKLIPTYRNGMFVCRDDESKPFDMAENMTEDLDLFCLYADNLTDRPSKGEDFPVPLLSDTSLGTLFLRCDQGNPAEVFHDIEALPRRNMFRVGGNADVRIDNLCLKYIGCHAIGAGGECVSGLTVTNCEIGWIGGAIQTYFGNDLNYPEGRRGSVTRFGNGVEIYGGCDHYTVKDCYIYQVYDAGITHQIITHGNKYAMKHIRYTDNLVENCVYSIEYFIFKTDGDTESYIDDCEISGNLLRFAGCGWGQQRHNTYTPSHIKSWNFENTASNYSVHDNIFDRSAYRLVHFVGEKQEDCPILARNTYVQKYGQALGSFGAAAATVPLAFFENADKLIENIFGEKDAKVYFLD